MILVDAHVHMYPYFPSDEALKWAVRNADSLGFTNPAVPIVLCLTERADFHFFDELSGVGVSRLSENLKAQTYQGRKIFFLRGFQIISTENIEVLGLGIEKRLPDRCYPALEIVRQIQASGGIAQLPWGLGKWLGKRKQPIDSLLNLPSPPTVGCTSLQPDFSRQSFQKRFTSTLLLYGSDSLPVPGEEKQIGSMLNVFELPWDETEKSLRVILSQKPSQLRGLPVGIFSSAARELRRRFS